MAPGGTEALVALRGELLRGLKAHPNWRASAVGVYRFWRDLGYAVGALLAGVVADALGLAAAVWFVAAVTFGSGMIAAMRMSETLAAKKLVTS